VRESNPEKLASLLRVCRMRVPSEARWLGLSIRRSGRLGKPVTQEEVAEVVQVSREWYARLELGRVKRASPVLLGRLADALMMDHAERYALFASAIPELREFTFDEAKALALEMSSLRSLLRKLWSASSEGDMLSIILEDCINRFKGIDLAMCARRDAVGTWVHAVPPPLQTTRESLSAVHRIITSEFDSLEIEEWNLCGALAQPGECCDATAVLRLSPIAKRVLATQKRSGLDKLQVYAAHLRSSHGFTANLAVALDPSRYSFSSLDSEVFGAVAEFASLALSR
jgi:transcriptional regulator with XRE-family HTH domain